MLVNMALNLGRERKCSTAWKARPYGTNCLLLGYGETLKATLPFQVGHGREKRATVPTRGGNSLVVLSQSTLILNFFKLKIV